MEKKGLWKRFGAICALLAVDWAFAAGCGGDMVCDPGETQPCLCATAEGSQVCNAAGTGWTPCDCSVEADADVDADGDVDPDASADADAAFDGDQPPSDADEDEPAEEAGTDGGPDADGLGGADGTIVPLYTYPSDPTWATVLAVRSAHPTVPLVAIVNSYNGPGERADAAYATGIASLHDAGVIVIGYVYTSYAGRPAATVAADIDRWSAFYGDGMDGIFFDEMTNIPGAEAYYRDLAAHAAGLGMPFTVGNPGTDTTASYVGTVDVILIYESAGLPDLGALGGWHLDHDRGSFGIIPYAVPSLDPPFVASARERVGWIYVTNDTLPNPWDSLPPYFDDLVAALET